MRDWINVTFDSVILLEPEAFDAALIGVSEGPDGRYYAVYDQAKLIEVLVADGLDHEGALEHFDFNIAGSHFEGSPMYLYRPETDDATAR